jgi:hypothetical protein
MSEIALQHEPLNFENLMPYIPENNIPTTLEIVVPHIWQDISMMINS